MSLCPTKVFIGHGNITALEPYSDVVAGEKMDLSGITKIAVCVGSVTSDSDLEPTAIAWEQDATTDDWVIHLKLGLIPSIVEGEQDVRVTVYDAEYPNGLVLTHDFPVEVIGPC